MKEMLIHTYDQDVSIIFVDDRRITEIFFPHLGHAGTLNNIYKGRVENVLPGMEAAFIDIGLERNAFLYVDDVFFPPTILDKPPVKGDKQNINQLLKKNQEVIVQIIKEAVAAKGARLTMQPTIAGRYLVYLPNSDYLAVSRRIEDEDKRIWLKEQVSSLLSEGGMIIRTAAADANAKDLADDYKLLQKKWRRIQGKAVKSKSPALIHQDLDFLQKIIRDTSSNDIDQIVVENEETKERVQDIIATTAPELNVPIKVIPEKDIFIAYDLEQQIAKSLRRKTWLKSGGYIIFDQTEALTVIDVNTGKFVGSRDLTDTIRITNLEAVTEICRQIRLRNIGGIIIIDFINMDNDNDKQTLMEYLEQEIKKDKTRITLMGMTTLGLVELTRKKIGNELSYSLEKECPNCCGKGKVLREDVVARHIRKELVKMAANTEAPAIKAVVNPTLAMALLGEHGKGLQKLELSLGKIIIVQSESNRALDDSIIRPDFEWQES